METLHADVAIAGGGVAGLACGAALADAGLRVVLAERDDWLGGRAASWVDPPTGDVVDIGPHVLSTEHRHVLALLERLGTRDAVTWQPQPLITLLDGQRVLRMRSSRWPPPLQGLPNLGQALRGLGPADLLSNRGVAWEAARIDEVGTLRLDGEDALHWLRRKGVTPRSIDWFWRPATLALLNLPLERCSAASFLRVFRLMLGRSGYHFGFPAVGLSELFVPGCRARIVAGGGQVLTAAPVQRAVVRDGRFGHLELAGGGRIVAPCGLLALPPEEMGAAWPGGDAGPREPRWKGRLRPVRYISTVLWLDRPLGVDRFWARVWRPGDLHLDFYDLSRIRRRPPGEPSIVASNAIHVDAAWHWTDDRLIAKTRQEIAEFAPHAAAAQVRHARVHRIGCAVPALEPECESLRPAQATPWGGLWIAGDWTATGLPCSMESAARSAALAAEAIAASLGRHVRLVQPLPETQGLVGLLRRRRPAGR